MIIVGSLAAYSRGLIDRFPKDKDIWIMRTEKNDEFPSDYDVKIIPSNVYQLVPKSNGRATADALYTIKCSHLGWDNPMWVKHKQDILLFKGKGCKIIPELYKALVEHWRQEFGNKDNLSLRQDKQNFFNDYVLNTHDHDFIHSIISYPNDPIYMRCLKDKEEVFTSKEKFDKLSFEDKVLMFTEEIVAIGCERWLCHPYWMEKGISLHKAHNNAVKKTIVNLTKNWATDFIVQNLEHFIKPRYDLYRKVTKQLNQEKENEMSIDGKKLIEEMYKDYLKENPEETYLPDDMADFFNEWVLEGDSGIPNYALIEHEGGGEGGSENVECVWSYKDKFYKVEYSYFSYHGYDYPQYDEIREVFPSKKTITVYN